MIGSYPMLPLKFLLPMTAMQRFLSVAACEPILRCLV